VTALEATEAPASRRGWFNNLTETQGITRRNSKERELQVPWVKTNSFDKPLKVFELTIYY
jgi:hypothetical protein